MCAGLVLAASCDSTPDPARPARAATPELVVASFDFPESQLLAEIYAVALEDAGIPIRRELQLGPRELVVPALLQGHVDVVPEYLGTALRAVAGTVAPAPPGGQRGAAPDAGTAPTTAAPAPVTVDPEAAEAHRALTVFLAGAGVSVLAPAPAQNQNAVVVERSTAERLGLADIGDLAPHAPSLTIAGPSECPVRPYCLVGLQDVYGLRFGGFVPVDGADGVVRALEDDVADVGVLFSTDPQLATRRLVALDDDGHLQPPENVVPVVRVDALARHGHRVATVLDAVSAELTTTSLRLLNWRVTVAGGDPAAEAAGWLTRRGLIAR